jgi:hypothetical protein
MQAKLAAALAILVALASPATATANQYMLKHPRREHCRAHYVKRVEKVKVHGRKVTETACVYHAPQQAVAEQTPAIPAPAPAPPTPSAPPTPAATPTLTPTFTFVTTERSPLVLLHQIVSATVETQNSGPGNGVTGVPVTVTLDNYTTGAVLGSFTEFSDGPSCAIETTIEGGYWVLKGDAAESYAACSLGTVTAPEGDEIDIMGSFAGNGQYASSTGEWHLFV